MQKKKKKTVKKSHTESEYYPVKENSSKYSVT